MNRSQYVDYQPFSRESFLQPLLIGVVAGLATWGIYALLRRFVVVGLLCDYSDAYCNAGPSVAFVVTLIAAHFLALIALVRSGALRPLLVIIAAVVTLWGVQAWLSGQVWWSGMLYSGLLFGLAYVYYAWINRLLFFPVALVITVLSVVIARVAIAMF